jgi:hypothetical protein
VENVTGTSIIDAYFGPTNLMPNKAAKTLLPEKLLMCLDTLIEKARMIDDELRRIAIVSELESLKVVVRWLSGESMSYVSLVEGVFGITPSKFGHHELHKAQETVEAASADLPGSNVSEKILTWREKNKISGQALKKMIKAEIIPRTEMIENLFRERVFVYLPTKVKNNGIVYKTITKKPWGAYNYYQGNYTSINTFNIDRSVNKFRLLGTLCHEYEHHIATLFMEKAYRERGLLDLSVVLLNTKNSIILEGTASCAQDFLNMQVTEYSELMEALNQLQEMIFLNVAYMQNVESIDNQTMAEYIASEIYLSIEEARKIPAFSSPLNPDGKPNLFRPYIYTYFYGRRDYVLPTYQKAQKRDKLKEFFQTLYLNPYSRSTATWKKAFQNI